MEFLSLVRNRERRGSRRDSGAGGRSDRPPGHAGPDAVDGHDRRGFGGTDRRPDGRRFAPGQADLAPGGAPLGLDRDRVLEESGLGTDLDAAREGAEEEEAETQAAKHDRHYDERRLPA
jgi:hypothetical protein